MMDGLGNTSLKALDRSSGLESLKQGNPVSCIHSKLRDEILKTLEKVLERTICAIVHIVKRIVSDSLCCGVLYPMITTLIR